VTISKEKIDFNKWTIIEIEGNIRV
jgi:hypothetical protein